MRSLLLLPLLIACTACPGGKYPPPANMDTTEQALAKLDAARAKATTYRAETISDYWLNDQRMKGTVKMMGTPDAKARFAAYDPMDNVVLDLACDGANFTLVDHQKNCVLTGPCNADSIARLMRIALEPDDFFYLAIGQTPVIEGATGKITWDADKGHVVLDLEGTGGSQRIVIDARDGRYDVVASEMRGPDDAMTWSVENKDFTEVASADGSVKLRVPGISLFKSPGKNSDILIDWKRRDLNAALPEQAFTLVPPAGLPTCQ
jgi:hypothetical protein